MKQGALIITTLIIAGAGLFFILRGDTKVAVETPQKQEEITIMLYKEAGFVTWKKQNDAEYVRMDVDELALPNNVYVKTADDGRGYVVLPDNSTISLDKNTEILISYTPKKTSIQQLLGQTYHRVEALVAGKEYEVRTPGTLAAVRGTKFGVSYDKKRRKTSVSVTEHKVDIVPIERMDEVATTTGKSVEAGMTAVLEDAPAVSTTTPEAPVKPRVAMVVQKTEKMIEEKKWVDENNLLDKELDKRKDQRKEYMKEFIKKMNEEKEKTKQESSPVRPTEEAKVRVKMIQNVIKEIEVERPDLKGDTAVPETKTESESTEPTETKPTAPTTSTTQGTTNTSGTSVSTTTATRTLKTFDTTSETLSPEDEKFTNDFYTEYEKYFYVDVNASVCERVANLSGGEVVVRLEKFTNSFGYILPNKDSLLLFANDIVSACKDRGITSKISALQSRFDVMYPFAQ